MWRNIYILICITVFSVYVHSLECGIAEQAADELVKDAFNKCFIKIEVVTLPPPNPSPDLGSNSTSNSSTTPNINSTLLGPSSEQTPDISNKTSTTPSNTTQGNGTSNETIQAYTNDGWTWRKKREAVATNVSTAEMKPQSDSSSNSTTTEIDKNCIIHCLFVNMKMSDEKGIPQRDLVTEVLLKNTEGRELRDFFQDSIDACFQECDQIEKTDLCEYSNKLVSCLGVKARANCADWNIFEMPFSK